MRRASVIVVSQRRPRALDICLTALEQLDYPEYEVVVVADSDTARAVSTNPRADRIKLISFDEKNVSRARNLGIEAAAGELVAFVDDDAVPEPTWLGALMAAFDDDSPVAAGGFVRGRNGVSWQWRAGTIDTGGRTHPLHLESDATVVLRPAWGRAIKTEGTNMAFRRDVLASLGGFDPAFRYYLDESDLNMRIARSGYSTAIVPGAEVHHSFAPSHHRRRDRVVSDLFEIGASHAAFLLRHCPPADREASDLDFRDQQRRRALAHMVAGRIGPDDVPRLLRGLERGAEEGRARAVTPLPPIARARDGFRQYRQAPPPRRKVVSGRWIHRDRLRKEAAHHAAAGNVTTLLIFSATALFGSVRFTRAGYWLHRGGQFGKMSRTEPLFRFRRLRTKIAAELARVSTQRGL